LVVICAFSAAVLVARLFQVQVLQHETWAHEAARLTHSGRLVPFRRGRIVDAKERILARDIDTYELVLVYRDFRRSHPLGQTAHALSLLEMRAVSLPEAAARLTERAFALVSLTPAQLDAFADGEGIPSLSPPIPPSDDARADHRARRAEDVRFYVRGLLGLDPKRWSELEDHAEDFPKRSYAELAEAVLPGDDASPRARLEERVTRGMQHLARIAERMEPPDEADALARRPVERLVQRLEESRRWVEDATASKLFAEAAGFAPGRIDSELLVASIDLDWIRRLLRWDDARLAEWTRTARQGWLESWRDGYAEPRLVLAALSAVAGRPAADEFLDALSTIVGPAGAVEAHLDHGEQRWREVDQLAVFDVLDKVFEAALPRELRARRREVLPFQAPGFDADLPDDPARRWDLLARAGAGAGDGPAGARSWPELIGSRRSVDRDELHTRARSMLDAWDADVQAALAELFAGMRAAADEDELGPGGGLRFAEEGLTRAAERAGYFLRDYGMRPRFLQAEPPDPDLVFLLTLFASLSPGIEAREVRERVYREEERPGGTLRPAAAIVGDLSSVALRDLVQQRRDARALRTLRALPERTRSEEEELRRLVGSVLLHDQVRGISGVEGLVDAVLSGTNGYVEHRGLEDVFGRGATWAEVRHATDGRDVRLTLDLDLQRAAARTLANPERVDDPLFDERWASDPVGAICLIRVDGDVLAAASEPTLLSVVGPDAQPQREKPIERVFRIPDFQPPGSVFKPFVAAIALDEVGLDPLETTNCGPIERGGCGYKDVRCHAKYGHGEVDLERALAVSCNAYFAALGERVGDDGFRRLAEVFGFGAPTGVRSSTAWTGEDGAPPLGLAEDTARGLFDRRFDDIERRLAGNGLGRVVATPAQLARAAAGLATGRLPALRIVDRIDGEPLPARVAAPLPLRAEHLQRVRDNLKGVVAAPYGSARNALSRAQLGFPIAAKTGSADLVSRDAADEEGRVRKHTWVACWVPADDPVAVAVVFLHDTATTSSHGAIYLMRQFLLQPETLAWLAHNGVERDE
jgi:cell division protein FtsI/penicillin-binding protein 2